MTTHDFLGRNPVPTADRNETRCGFARKDGRFGPDAQINPETMEGA